MRPCSSSLLEVVSILTRQVYGKSYRCMENHTGQVDPFPVRMNDIRSLVPYLPPPDLDPITAKSAQLMTIPARLGLLQISSWQDRSPVTGPRPTSKVDHSLGPSIAQEITTLQPTIWQSRSRVVILLP